jgi:hypothetical protein
MDQYRCPAGHRSAPDGELALLAPLLVNAALDGEDPVHIFAGYREGIRTANGDWLPDL